MSFFSQKPAAQGAAQPSLFGSNNSTLQSNLLSAPFSLAANSAPATSASTLGASGNTGLGASTGSFANKPQTQTFVNATGSGASLPAQIAPGASSNRILKDLMDSAHNLPKLHHGSIEPINLTLSELRKETLELRKNDPASNHTKAHYLLSRSGVNAADFEHDLNALPSAQAGELASEAVVQGRHETAARDLSSEPKQENIDNYLIAKKDETIWNAIELLLVLASRDFDKYINLSVSIDWKVRKDALKKQLGIPVRLKITSEQLAQSFSWKKSLPGTYRILSPLPASQKTSLATKLVSRDKFEGNAKVVYELNESRLDNRPYPVCLRFEELCKLNADSKSKQMAEIWRVLADLSGEKDAKINQEQLFYELYKEAVPEQALKKSVVRNSKTSLELQFFAYMDEIYLKDDKKPQEFLPATNVNKVSYFIHRVITKNHDSKLMDRTLNYNGVPIWALIFYLMRSGLYAEAVELTEANIEAFSKFDRNFPVYMAQYAETGGFSLPSELQDRIGADYAQNFQFVNEDAPTFDPYKYAVYKIIGKCDLVKKNLPAALNLSIEDWLWFHMLILNEFAASSKSELLYDNYRLENLQRKVLSLGPARFNASSNHPVYAKTLIMLGLYELAVQYVYESISECDAVHLAVGLSYYGLLRTTKTGADDLIVLDANGAYQVNFSRLLGSYTRTFKISDPKVAAQYLILICLAKGGHNAEETAKCHEALRELVSISREFGLLLGDLTPDTGDKIPGILERQRTLINLPDLRNFYIQITELSAQRCEEEGRVFDALRLYQLCQEYDTVVQLLNRLLSEVLSLTPLEKPLLTGEVHRSPMGDVQPAETSENNLILLSRKLKSVFERNSYISSRISSKEKQINEFLLPVVDIRERFVGKDWQGALDRVQALGLVPVTESDDFIGVRRAAEALNGYDAKLVKVIPSVLTIAMTCIAEIHRQAQTKQYGVGAHERAELDRLKAVAKNCMVYAGMIQYKMPRETYSLLVNLEALL